MLSVAQAQGYSKDKIESIRKVLSESKNPTVEQSIELLRKGASNLPSSFRIPEKPEDEQSTKESKDRQSASNSERPYVAQIVPETGLMSYLEQGFDVVATTPDGIYIVRRKNHVT